MPRLPRAAPGGLVYHVLNRGNERRKLFHTAGDAKAFLRILLQGKSKADISLLSFCLMPNHWHLCLRPCGDEDLSDYMSWVTNTHAHRYRRHYHNEGNGHVYQGRFKSFPVEDDHHLLTVLRYIEANPLRANLAAHPADWKWSSYCMRRGLHANTLGSYPGLLDAWPIDEPSNWEGVLLNPLDNVELTRIRESAERGKPYGGDLWTKLTAAKLKIMSTLRKRGRPKKEQL